LPPACRCSAPVMHREMPGNVRRFCPSCSSTGRVAPPAKPSRASSTSPASSSPIRRPRCAARFLCDVWCLMRDLCIGGARSGSSAFRHEPLTASSTVSPPLPRPPLLPPTFARSRSPINNLSGKYAGQGTEKAGEGTQGAAGMPGPRAQRRAKGPRRPPLRLPQEALCRQLHWARPAGRGQEGAPCLSLRVLP
jgi:hypothetical protein